jgi:hypothetical protein
MRAETPKHGWENSRYRVESSKRLLGDVIETGTLTAQCGRNFHDAPEKPTNVCLKEDTEGLRARINALVPETITEKQAREWLVALPTTNQLTIRGACLVASRSERSDVYRSYFPRDIPIIPRPERCGAVVVLKQRL